MIVGSLFSPPQAESPPPPPPLPPAAIAPTMANAAVQSAGANQVSKAAKLAGQTLKTSPQGDIGAAPKASQSLGPA